MIRVLLCSLLLLACTQPVRAQELTIIAWTYANGATVDPAFVTIDTTAPIAYTDIGPRGGTIGLRPAQACYLFRLQAGLYRWIADATTDCVDPIGQWVADGYLVTWVTPMPVCVLLNGTPLPLDCSTAGSVALPRGGADHAYIATPGRVVALVPASDLTAAPVARFTIPVELRYQQILPVVVY